MTPLRHTLLAVALCGGMGVTAVFAEGTPAAAPSGSAPAQQAKLPEAIKPGQLPRPNANPLNLDPAQQKALAVLRKEQMDNLQKIHALQRELMELSNSDSYDEDKAEKLVDQIAKATEADLLAQSKQANTFYLSLSPEQKRQYKAFEQRRQKMLEQRMGVVSRPMAAPPAKPPAQKTP